MTEPQLAPCPFCGGEDIRMLDVSYDDPGFSAHCFTCNTLSGAFLTEEEAAAAWNKRAPQWEPVEEDGEISTWVSVENKGRHIAVYVDDDRYAEETLPEGYAICRQRPQEPTP